MKIYPDEQSISNKILANRTAIFGGVKLSVTSEKTAAFINSVNSLSDKDTSVEFKKSLAAVSSFEHPDLMYGSAILCSTNINLNDDAFLPEHTWAARNTPINTPFNDNHEETNIIGHIIAARVLNKKGEIIPDDTDKVPDFFDIETDFVVYKDIYKDLAAEIAKGAVDGTKFVSMEAMLDDFDFGLINASDNMDVIARNEKTSFLTKHLRVYGGTGQYQDKKLVRVLTDFRFSGMGNVDNPANSRSKYTKINNFNNINALDGIINYNSDLDIGPSKDLKNAKAYVYITKGEVMTIENLEQAKVVIDNLTKEVSDLKKVETEVTQAKITKLVAENEEVSNSLSAEKGKVDVAQQKIAELEKSLAEAKTSLDTAKSELKVKADQLDKIASDAKATDRLNQLTSAGITLSDEKKTKYLSMNDEAFAEILEFAQSLKAKPKDKEDEPDPKDKKDKKKDDEDKDKKDAKAALDAAKENKEVDLNPAAKETVVDIKAIAERLVAAVVKTRNKPLQKV